MTKASPKTSTVLNDDDRTWLMAQAEELGLDDAGAMLRFLVRWARNSGVCLSVSSAGHERHDRRADPVHSAHDGGFDPRGALAPGGDPIDEGAVADLVAGVASDAAQFDGAAPAHPEQALGGRVIPLQLNKQRGYLRGSAAIPGWAG